MSGVRDEHPADDEETAPVRANGVAAAEKGAPTKALLGGVFPHSPAPVAPATKAAAPPADVTVTEVTELSEP